MREEYNKLTKLHIEAAKNAKASYIHSLEKLQPKEEGKNNSDENLELMSDFSDMTLSYKSDTSNDEPKSQHKFRTELFKKLQ